MNKLKFFALALVVTLSVPVYGLAADKVNPFFRQNQQPDKVNKQMLEELKAEMAEIKASMGASEGGEGVSIEGSGIPVVIRSKTSKTVTETSNYIISGRMSDGVLLEPKSSERRALMVKNGAFIDECYVRYPFFECPVEGEVKVASPASPAAASSNSNATARPSAGGGEGRGGRR